MSTMTAMATSRQGVKKRQPSWEAAALRVPLAVLGGSYGGLEGRVLRGLGLGKGLGLYIRHTGWFGVSQSRFRV